MKAMMSRVIPFDSGPNADQDFSHPEMATLVNRPITLPG